MMDVLPFSSGWESHKQFVGDGNNLVDENLLIVSLSKRTWEQKPPHISVLCVTCFLFKDRAA